MAEMNQDFHGTVRDSVARTLGQVSSILQSALREWLDETLDRLLSEQPAVVMNLQPAQRSALKLQFELAREDAIANAESMFRELDLDIAAREAAGYETTAPVLELDARVYRLLDEPISVLADGGFRVATSEINFGELLETLQVSVAIALGSYAKHILGLRPVSPSEARVAWNSA